MIILFWLIWVILIAASFAALRSMLLQEKQHSLREAKLNARLCQLEKDLISKDKAIEKLNKDLSVNMQMYNGLKNQYDELERDMEKLQQELTNKDSALKVEQAAHQELRDKHEALLNKTYGLSEKKEETI